MKISLYAKIMFLFFNKINVKDALILSDTYKIDLTTILTTPEAIKKELVPFGKV